MAIQTFGIDNYPASATQPWTGPAGLPNAGQTFGIDNYPASAKQPWTGPGGLPNAGTVFRNSQTAKQIFVDSQYRLSPKYGFLFYVEFDFNPLITNISNTTAQELGMIVKSVSLPKYTIQVKEHNAYNRKNYVQNNIKYDPVNITFHDDQSDNVLNFWYDYYSYYYRDADYDDSTYGLYHKYQARPAFEWGYTPRPAVGYASSTAQQPYQYIQAVRIYSLYQGNFDEYELINPIITRFQHGEMDNASNEILRHEMSLQFETVKYYTGQVTQNTAGGFIDLHYDLTPSPNNYPTGSTPQYETNSDVVTDLANSSTIDYPATLPIMGTFNSASGGLFNLSSGMSSLTSSLSLSPVNSGGTGIPSLGSLTQGVTSTAALGQMATSAGINLAGSAASTLANGLTSQIPGGGTVVALAAAAIANPSALLKTVENGALSLGLGIAVNAAQNQLNGLVQGQSNALSGELTNLNNTVGASVFGDGTTLTGGVSQAFTNLGQSISNFVSLGQFSTNATLQAANQSIIDAIGPV